MTIMEMIRSNVGRRGVEGVAVAKRRMRGLTLIEAATVLAILAIVVAGIMVLYRNAETSRKTTAALNQLNTIQSGVNTLYSGQSTFTGVSAAAIANSQALPASMVSGTTIKHAFNGVVNIAPADIGGGTASGYSIEFTNVPKDPCVKMITFDLGRGLYSVSVGGTTRSQAGTPPPFDPAAANTACSSSSNTISWTFG